MKKIFLSIIFLINSVWGVGFYDIGDTIPIEWQERLKIDKYSDKLYVVYLYTPWCSECKKDPKILHELIDSDADVIGRSICFDKMVNECKKFRNKTGLNLTEENDYANHFTNRMGLKKPRTLVYIKKGVIVFIRDSDILDFRLELQRDIRLNKEPF